MVLEKQTFFLKLTFYLALTTVPGQFGPWSIRPELIRTLFYSALGNSDLDPWSIRTPTTGQFGPFCNGQFGPHQIFFFGQFGPFYWSIRTLSVVNSDLFHWSIRTLPVVNSENFYWSVRTLLVVDSINLVTTMCFGRAGERETSLTLY